MINPTKKPSKTEARDHRRTAKAISALRPDLPMPHHEDGTKFRDQINKARSTLRKLPERPESQYQVDPVIVFN